MPPFGQDFNDILPELPCRERKLITNTIIFVRTYLEGRPVWEKDEEARNDVADEVADYVWQVYRKGKELADWRIKYLAKKRLASYWRRRRPVLSLDTSGTPEDGEEGLYWLLDERAAQKTPHGSSEPERDAMMSEMLKMFWQELNATDRQVLVLRAKGMDNEQIADHLGTTKHAIEQRLHRIRKKFDFLF